MRLGVFLNSFLQRFKVSIAEISYLRGWRYSHLFIIGLFYFRSAVNGIEGDHFFDFLLNVFVIGRQKLKHRD